MTEAAESIGASVHVYQNILRCIPEKAMYKPNRNTAVLLMVVYSIDRVSEPMAAHNLDPQQVISILMYIFGKIFQVIFLDYSHLYKTMYYIQHFSELVCFKPEVLIRNKNKR